MQEIIAVHPRPARSEADNPVLRLADGVALKDGRARRKQVGQYQPVFVEGVVLKEQMANAHHADGLVVAPKHVVANHQGVHGRLDAIRRITAAAFRQIGGDEVVFDEVDGHLVGDAAYRLKADGRGSAFEVIAGDMVAVALDAVAHVGNLNVDLPLVEDIVGEVVFGAVAGPRLQLDARDALGEEAAVDTT